jgi:two-component system, chemotaxis family, chemotaxis protein CheY
VTATEDGEKAREQLQAGGFDIVVTDWEMPLLSGLELVKRIRESAKGGLKCSPSAWRWSWAATASA